MYSDENRSLKFYGIGLPSFIDYAADKQQVIPIENHQCELIFDVEMRLKGIFSLFKGKAKKRFTENFKRVQNDLKVHVETAESSA